MHTEIEQSVETLYAAYAPMIVRYLARLTGSYETAEDLAQDTFVKALRHQGQLAADINVRAWLFRIATNTAYDDFRQRKRRATTPLTEFHAETLVAAPVASSVEEGELLWAVLGQLPECYRVPLLMQGYAGYRVNDIAALLGWKVGTVKSRLHRARTQFQQRYTAINSS